MQENNDDPILDVLMITYNRPDYTRQSLERLLESVDHRVRVWVWHNGTDEATLGVVRSLSSHSRFHHLEVSRENKRLREPTNWFWKNSDAPFVSKVDDDCLLPDAWFAPLIDAHHNNPKLGIIGCWTYYEHDFFPKVALRKIRQIEGGHQMMLNAWIGGTGYVMKRAMQQETGYLEEMQSFTSFCINGASLGWKVGWYYPFIHQEHMDDPRSEFYGIQSEEEFQKQRPLSAINNNIHTLAEWKARIQYTAYVIQSASPNPWFYTGWRAKIRNATARLKKYIGIKESWRSVC